MHRLESALEHWDWTLDDWRRVTWLDRTRYNRVEPYGGVWSGKNLAPSSRSGLL